MSEYTVKVNGWKKVVKKSKKIFRRAFRKMIKQAANEVMKDAGTVKVDIPYPHVTLINELVKQGEIQTEETDNEDGSYTHTINLEADRTNLKTGE